MIALKHLESVTALGAVAEYAPWFPLYQNRGSFLAHTAMLWTIKLVKSMCLTDTHDITLIGSYSDHTRNEQFIFWHNPST